MRLWTRLDRYVLREVRNPFFLGLTGFTFVLLVNYLFLLAQQTIEKAVPLKLVLGFLLARLPGFLTLTIPMAALLAVLVGAGRLSSQHEFLALRAMGISFPRLFRPILVGALLLTVLTLGMSHYLHPWGRLKERALFQEILRARDFSKEVDPGVFFDRLPGGVLFASTAQQSSEGRVFGGILLYRETNDGSAADLILARRGQGEFDRETGQVSLRLDDVEWHAFQPGRPESYTLVRTPHETITFPPDPRFRARARLLRVSAQEEMVGLELYRSVVRRKEELDATTSEGSRIAARVRLRKASIELSHRWAYPMAVVILVFVAFPLASSGRRGGRFTGLAQAIGVIFLFWLLFSLGDGFAEQGTVSPWLGPWLAHLAVGSWGVLLWVLLLKNKGTRWRVPEFLVGLALSILNRRRRNSGSTAPATAEMKARWSGLTRLDTYLASGLARMLFAALAVLVVLVATLGFKQAIDSVDASAARFPWSDIVSFVGLSIPGQFQFLLPIGALFGVMVSLAALARGGEIVALKSCGISPGRMTLPLLAVTILLSLFYAVAQESVVPAAEREAQRALDRIKGRVRAETNTTGRRWVAGGNGHFWVYLDWDGAKERLAAPGLLLVDLARATVLERVEATRAEYSGGEWQFAQGWRRRFSPGSKPVYEPFEELSESLPEKPELFGATRRRLLFNKVIADQMSFRDLLTHMRRVSRAGYPSAPLEVGLYKKLSSPFLPALLVMIGIPLMVGGSSRKGSLYGFGVALLIALGFWTLLAVTTSLGREEVLSPAVAVLSAPFLLLMLGLILIARAK